MSKQHSIRWSDKDNRRIDNLVKRFNRKLNKLAADPSLEGLLPEKATRGGLKKTVTTRSELNMKLNQLNRFMKKDAAERVTTPGGYELTKYDVREYKEKVRIRNIQKTYERKRLELTPERGVATQQSKVGLLPRSSKLPATKKEFEKGMVTLERQLSVQDKQAKLAQYKENYIEGIKQLPGYQDTLLTKIEKLSDLDLFNATVANPKLIIEFYYDEEQDEDTRATEILDEWNELYPSYKIYLFIYSRSGNSYATINGEAAYYGDGVTIEVDEGDPLEFEVYPDEDHVFVRWDKPLVLNAERDTGYTAYFKKV